MKLTLTLILAVVLKSGFSQTTNSPHVTTKPGQVLAWENLYFGMRKDTVEMLIQQSGNPNVYMVGDYECRIHCYYNASNILYKISLISVPLSLRSYDTGLKLWYDEIVQNFVNDFGQPTSDLGYPDIAKLKHGKTQVSSVWKLKAKTIQIGMGRNFDDGFVSIFIFKNPN